MKVYNEAEKGELGRENQVLGRKLIVSIFLIVMFTFSLVVIREVKSAPRVSDWTVWHEPFDDNSNGWTFVNGASITGSLLDTSPTYSRGLNSLNFLHNRSIEKITLDYDAYRSNSSSAIVGVIFSYLHYKIWFNWNYYGPHSVNGVWYRNSTQGVSVPLPLESGWRKTRIVLEDLTSISPRASYYFENEGVLKTIAENQTVYFLPGYGDLPESIAIRMGNGFSGAVQYDNLTITYCPEYSLTIQSSPTGIPFIVDNATQTTTWTETYCEITSVTFTMPEIHTDGDGIHHWDQWSDGDQNRTRTLVVDSNISLTAEYTIPLGYQLTVTSTPVTGIPFTIDGAPETTPFIALLLEGEYVIQMPKAFDIYCWKHWQGNEDTNRTRTITLNRSSPTYTAVYVYDYCIGGSTVSIKHANPSSWIMATLLLTCAVLATGLFSKRKRTK